MLFVENFSCALDKLHILVRKADIGLDLLAVGGDHAYLDDITLGYVPCSDLAELEELGVAVEEVL